MADNQELLLKIKEQGDLVRKLKAAKESSAKGKKIDDVNTTLLVLDKHLSQFSYIGGYTPSSCDTKILRDLGKDVDLSKYMNVKRWWYHMRSFSDSERSLFPTLSVPKEQPPYS